MNKIKFRASAAGKLMAGGNEFSEKNFVKLCEYFIRDVTEGKNIMSPLIETQLYNFVETFNSNNFRQIKENEFDFHSIAENATKRKLTANMQGELRALAEKIEQPFELGKTAKSYIESVWLENEYEYSNIVWTDEIMKGLLHESDSLGLLIS